MPGRRVGVQGRCVAGVGVWRRRRGVWRRDSARGSATVPSPRRKAAPWACCACCRQSAVLGGTHVVSNARSTSLSVADGAPSRPRPAWATNRTSANSSRSCDASPAAGCQQQGRTGGRKGRTGGGRRGRCRETPRAVPELGSPCVRVSPAQHTQRLPTRVPHTWVVSSPASGATVRWKLGRVRRSSCSASASTSADVARR